MEQFANAASTTLNGAINSSVTSITVTAATGFPAAAQYRVIIDSEVLLVTAGAGTTTWTVTRGAEGTTAAAHSSLAAVTHILTAGALTQFRTDLFQTGGYSSRPSAGNAGVVYQANDATMFAWQDNGSAWDLLRPVYLPSSWAIDLSGWTAHNLTGVTATAVGGSVVWQNPTSGSDNLRYYLKTLPSTPYTLTLCCMPASVGISFQMVMLGLRESSSGKVSVVSLMQGATTSIPDVHQISADQYTNDTTYSAGIFRVVSPSGPARPVFLRIADNGTTITYSYSLDGITFIALGTQGHTAFGTNNQVLIGMNTTTSVWSGLGYLFGYKES
jgi:hypothetical protein